MKALFLDRDGVINKEIEGHYVLSPESFEFYPDVLEALVKLKDHFDLFIIVTNQRCIGRGLLTVEGLSLIHKKMLNVIQEAGGRIDKIYFAPAVEEDNPWRKPNNGMGLQAKEDFPAIDFNQSFMVGNNPSDMKFGKSLGMKTVFLTTTISAFAMPNKLVDFQYNSLAAFALAATEWSGV